MLWYNELGFLWSNDFLSIILILFFTCYPNFTLIKINIYESHLMILVDCIIFCLSSTNGELPVWGPGKAHTIICSAPAEASLGGIQNSPNL